MSALGLLAVRAIAGGSFVVIFTLLGEWMRPRSFGGLAAAAPAVALASLLITLATSGEAAAWRSALGMVAGAVALLAACVVAIDSVKRFRAARGTLGAIAVWLAVAGALWATALR